MKLQEMHTLDELEKWIAELPETPFEPVRICLQIALDGMHAEEPTRLRPVNDLIMIALSDVIIPTEEHETKARKMQSVSEAHLLVDVFGAICLGTL